MKFQKMNKLILCKKNNISDDDDESFCCDFFLRHKRVNLIWFIEMFFIVD